MTKPEVFEVSEQQPATGVPATGAAATKSRTALIQLILRGVQFAFAIIVIGTIGAVINSNNRTNGCYYGDDDFDYLCYWTPSSFKYAIFAGVWTILVTGYFVASTFVPQIYHTIPALALDALSIIFWFASFVSVAVWLGATGWYDHVGTSKGRSLLDAGTVFGAFIWLSYVATFLLTLLLYIKNRKASNTGGVQNGVQMQQHAPA